MNNEDEPAVVIDNGSGLTKAGFSGDDDPKCVFPTVLGIPKKEGFIVGLEQKDFYIGEEALKKKDDLQIHYPIDQCQIKSWNDMEKIWNHIFVNEVRVQPYTQPLLFAEPSIGGKARREELAKFFFESGVPKMYFAIQDVLSLYSVGRTSGFVLDFGFDSLRTIPIYEGYAISHAISSIPLGGKHLNNFLLKMLKEKEKNKVDDIEVAREIKEKQCMVVLDYDNAIKESQEIGKIDKIHTLPDGSKISISSEQFKCPEALFQPNFVGIDCDGCHKVAFDSISKCDLDVRKDMYQNIVLVGGTSMFEGIKKRVKKEIKALAPSTVKVKVIASPERKYSVWIGGSLISSLPQFKIMWITKQAYDEVGPTIVYRKCF